MGIQIFVDEKQVIKFACPYLVIHLYKSVLKVFLHLGKLLACILLELVITHGCCEPYFPWLRDYYRES